MNPVAPLALAEQAVVRPALALQVTVAMEELAAPARRDRLPTARVTAQRVAWVVRAARAARQSQARPAVAATAATAVPPAPGVMDRILRHQVRLASMVAPEEVLVPAVLEVPAAAQPLGKAASAAAAGSVALRAAVAMVEAALTATRSLRTVRSGAKVEQVEPSVRADQVATVPGAVPGASMGPTAFRVTEGMVAAAGPAVRSLSGLALVG